MFTGDCQIHEKREWCMSQSTVSTSMLSSIRCILSCRFFLLSHELCLFFALTALKFTDDTHFLLLNGKLPWRMTELTDSGTVIWYCYDLFWYDIMMLMLTEVFHSWSAEIWTLHCSSRWEFSLSPSNLRYVQMYLFNCTFHGLFHFNISIKCDRSHSHCMTSIWLNLC